MEILEFKDYPDTTTPYTAENLNLIQNNAKNSIDNLQEQINNIPQEIAQITSGSYSGNVVIGKLGIEWGQVEITSGGEGTSAQGTTIYTGYDTITFKNNYKNTPQIITTWRGGYYNQISTYSSNTSITSCRIGIFVSSANSTRTVGYIIIGEVE